LFGITVQVREPNEAFIEKYKMMPSSEIVVYSCINMAPGHVSNATERATLILIVAHAMEAGSMSGYVEDAAAQVNGVLLYVPVGPARAQEFLCAQLSPVLNVLVQGNYQDQEGNVPDVMELENSFQPLTLNASDVMDLVLLNRRRFQNAAVVRELVSSLRSATAVTGVVRFGLNVENAADLVYTNSKYGFANCRETTRCCRWMKVIVCLKITDC